jgi:hypothetical protein
MSYEKKDRVISVTRAQLITLRNANKLIPSMVYFISDRDIWLEALENNLLGSQGRRKMRVPMTTYYTPQIVTGIVNLNFQGIYGQAITAGSTPVSTTTIGGTIYLAIWGGRLWERNTSGADGTPPNAFTLNSTGWTLLVDTSTFYETKYFNVEYLIDSDLILKQEDWKGNIVYNTTVSGLQTVTHTDWNNDLILNNTSRGIYNNYRSTTQRAEIDSNNCDGIIFGNFQRFINNNKILGDIRNNTGGPTTDILNNRCIEIYNNSIGGTISGNILPGSIFFNTNNGNILNNINLGNINNNSNNGFISNNRNIGAITSNGSNVTNINQNSNNGTINSNSNSGVISNNSNNGAISLNTHNGQINGNSNSSQITQNSSNAGTTMTIFNNRNNGQIVRNNSTANISIQNNINNGDIGNILSNTNRSANVQDTVVTK